MRLAFLVYIFLIAGALLAISIAVYILVRGIRQTNAGQNSIHFRKAKISRRIRRQIEEIVRSYDEQWDDSRSDDAAVDTYED